MSQATITTTVPPAIGWNAPIPAELPTFDDGTVWPAGDIELELDA